MNPKVAAQIASLNNGLPEDRQAFATRIYHDLLFRESELIRIGKGRESVAPHKPAEYRMIVARLVIGMVDDYVLNILHDDPFMLLGLLIGRDIDVELKLLHDAGITDDQDTILLHSEEVRAILEYLCRR